MIYIKQNQKINSLIIAVLLKNRLYNKITEIEGTILDVSNLATTTTLTTVENKITQWYC